MSLSCSDTTYACWMKTFWRTCELRDLVVLLRETSLALGQHLWLFQWISGIRGLRLEKHSSVPGECLPMEWWEYVGEVEIVCQWKPGNYPRIIQVALRLDLLFPSLWAFLSPEKLRCWVWGSKTIASQSFCNYYRIGATILDLPNISFF